MELNCGSINDSYIGKSVELYGWCRYKRDHGGKLFIDLADFYGTTQLVFEGKVKEEAGTIGKEYVLHISGTVRKRDNDTVDSTNLTGTVEVYVELCEIMSKSAIPPFELIDEKRKFLANEELRLKYRYLDLRRGEMAENMAFRDKVTKSIRSFFWKNGFLELETPILVKDTYETGSRTFVVPSRINSGRFYSLPQSPQIYKQLCMVAGLDKYFQIARCFRDEDAREDRQPEFTQVDFEVSFKDESYIQKLVESMMAMLFKEVLGKSLELPFRHVSYDYAMENYGTDKPDLRFDNKITDVTDELKGCSYNIINRVLDNNGKAKALVFDADFNSASHRLNKAYMLQTIELAKVLGLGGLTWLYVKNGKIMSEPSSIAESLDSVSGKLMEKLKPAEGSVIVICSDTSEHLLLNALGRIRKEIGEHIGAFNAEYQILWVDGFALFEKDEVTGALKCSHNPFTAPLDEDISLLDKEPWKAKSRQYDLVINGNEIGGGSIRIRDPRLQMKVLELAGLTGHEIERSFGFMIEALGYGAPMHGGMALGLDRLTALLKNRQSIRDFILFPKNKKYESPLDDSPTTLSDKRLSDDYNIKLE